MTLKLTPEILAHAYEFLRSTPPFRRWKLPPYSGFQFRVTKHLDRYAHFNPAIPEIAVSERKVGHTHTLLVAVAHEMVHASGPLGHGAAFKRKADLVCKHHGFDPKEF